MMMMVTMLMLVSSVKKQFIRPDWSIAVTGRLRPAHVGLICISHHDDAMTSSTTTFLGMSVAQYANYVYVGGA